MGDSGKKICRLCGDKTPPTECASINETNKEMLKILLIDLNFDINDYAFACNKCLESLQDSFAFKSRCITTFQKAVIKAGVSKVFSRKMRSNNKKMKSNQVCLLCRSLIENNNFNHITDLEGVVLLKNMITKCLPEIDLNTNHELICKPCLRSMKGFYDLMENCQKVELQLTTCSSTTAILNEVLQCKNCDDPEKPVIFKKECSEPENEKNEPTTAIKCEEVHIKDEVGSGLEASECLMSEGDNISSGKNDFSMMERHIKKSVAKGNEVHNSDLDPYVMEVKAHKGPYKAFGCWECPYETNTREGLANHIIKHKEKSEVVMHKCLLCPFKSTSKLTVLKHESWRHYFRKFSNGHMEFKCAFCDYRGKEKTNLMRHISARHESENANVYDCQQCSYKTLQRSTLHRHIKLHGVEVQYKCPSCEKIFTRKTTLDNHLLRIHDEATLDI